MLASRLVAAAPLERAAAVITVALRGCVMETIALRHGVEGGSLPQGYSCLNQAAW